MTGSAPQVQIVRVLMTEWVEDRPTAQLWVAAFPRNEAVAAVQRMLPEGWIAELSNQHLTPEHVAHLELRPGEVREMTS